MPESPNLIPFLYKLQVDMAFALIAGAAMVKFPHDDSPVQVLHCHSPEVNRGSTQIKELRKQRMYLSST